MYRFSSKTILVAAAACCLMLFAAPARADDTAAARKHFQKGTTFYDLGKYAEAVKEFEAGTLQLASSASGLTHNGTFGALEVSSVPSSITVSNSIFCNGLASNSQSGRTLSGYIYLTNVQAGLQISLFAVNAGATVTYPQGAPAAQTWTRISAVTSGGANSWTSFGVTMTGLVANTAVFFDDFSWN